MSEKGVKNNEDQSIVKDVELSESVDEKIKERVNNFVEKVFLKNKKFLTTAKKGYRKHAEEKVQESLDVLHKKILEEVISGEYDLDNLNQDKLKELAVNVAENVSRSGEITISKGFKKAVRMTCNYGNGKTPKEIIVDLEESEISGKSTGNVEQKGVKTEEIELAKKRKASAEKRKNFFEKKFGIDENYTLISTDENGHEAPTDSFTLVEYIVGDTKGKDRVKIDWHNDGKKEEVPYKEFIALLKKGFTKEEMSILSKEKGNNDKKNKKDSEKREISLNALEDLLDNFENKISAENFQDLGEEIRASAHQAFDDFSRKLEEIKKSKKSVSEIDEVFTDSIKEIRKLDELEKNYFNKNNKNKTKKKVDLEEKEEDAKVRADKHRDEYFKEMGWGKKSSNEKVDEELAGDLELADKFAKESDDEKHFVDQKLERKLEEILKDNPEIEKEVVRKTLDAGTRETAYDKADLKDKILMLLGEHSNQARQKYLEKDYDMDRRLGGMKRFFGKTFKIGNFEEEINSYKENYEIAREKYKNAILELEGLGDREEAEILVRDFQISEQLRWRNDSLDIAIENNPIYENSKKFLLGAVNKYREMRKWPGDKISELFGLKGLSKGVGIVSGMLITGKALKEIGMVGNPAYRVFSVAVASVGYKQLLETVTEKKRIKGNEKKVKEVLNTFGAEFEAGKNIDGLSAWLSDKNKSLDKDIQGEKYWKKWRTVMSGGLAMGTFFGGSLLSEKIMEHFGGGIHHNQIEVDVNDEHSLKDTAVNSGKIKEEVEKFLGDNNIKTEKILNPTVSPTEPNIPVESLANDKIIEEPFPINSGNENNIEVDTQQIDNNRVISTGNAEFRGAVEVNKAEISVNQDDLRRQDLPSSENSEVSQNNVPEKTIDITNPNVEQHRNITGSEMQIAYGLGFTPTEYSRLNDITLVHISDAKISELLEKVGGSNSINLNETTVGEFFRQLNINDLPKNIQLSDMTGEKYIEYLANVINNEAMELKKEIAVGNIGKWNQMKNHLAIGELDENFGKFYTEISKKLSLYARPTESVEKWLMRVTRFSYDRGILVEVKQNLENIVSKK